MGTIWSKRVKFYRRILKIGIGGIFGVNYNIGIMNIRKSFRGNISDFPAKTDFDQHKFFGDVNRNFPANFTLSADFDHFP